MENPLIDLAQAYIESTNTLIFLTGKAGTGKTTFLRQVRETSAKKLVVIAPTGVAAINAGGMTIHSLFQLPFGPLLPNQDDDRPEIKYNAEKRELLRSLELLIIDEISMVRPDVLDQIDLILRNIRGNQHAFGGVQLLLIGDLAQLSPIIRNEEWALLRPYYATPYFFSCMALQQTDYVRIELDKVYRQNDPLFVEILNAMREQQLTEEHLGALNARYVSNAETADAEGYITLTTHNRIAQGINAGRLDGLTGDETVYKAIIRGEFPADAYPTETTLKLKMGAQVMFVKNDSSAEKRYYNGKIGTVTHLEADAVQVTTAEGNEIRVEALEWTNIRYELSGEDINEDNAGSFAQIPLKLAWAITIHKSQGLTFGKAIVDVGDAFTHGQTYVALSRCRSLEGLMLRSPVSGRNVIADPVVNRFNKEAEARQPDQNTLLKHREAYRLFLLSEMFNFSGLKERRKKFEGLLTTADEELFGIADKMRLPGFTDERIRKAAAYFAEKLETVIQSLYISLAGYVGSSKEMAGKADELLQWLVNRHALCRAFSNQNFTTVDYLRLVKQKQSPEISLLKKLNAKPNEKLYEQLLQWRENTAQTESVLPSMLFSEQTLAAIAEKLPATLKAISGIKGIGQEKTSRYGAQILTLIRTYQQDLQGGNDQASLF